MSSHAVSKQAAAPERVVGTARRPYVRPYPKLWWLERRSYFLFLVRELTSAFVAAYCLFLVYALYQLGQGPAEYVALLETLRSPLSVVLHLIVLAFALYHTITWFNLTPKILVVPMGEDEEVPPVYVAGAVYAGWIVVSAVILWLVLRG
jgi:fumarate reductase subunit C